MKKLIGLVLCIAVVLAVQVEASAYIEGRYKLQGRDWMGELLDEYAELGLDTNSDTITLISFTSASGDMTPFIGKTAVWTPDHNGFTGYEYQIGDTSLQIWDWNSAHIAAYDDDTHIAVRGMLEPMPQVAGQGLTYLGPLNSGPDLATILGGIADIQALAALSYGTKNDNANAQALLDLYTNLTTTPTLVDGINWKYLSDAILPGDTGGTLYAIGDGWVDNDKYYIKLGSGLLGEPLGGGVPEPSSMAVSGIAIGLLGLIKRFRRTHK